MWKRLSWGIITFVVLIVVGGFFWKYALTNVSSPYNLEDVECFVQNESVTSFIDVGTGEDAKIVSGIININKAYPAAFLVNEKNEILYEYEASYKTGTRIEKILVEDVNGDGLDDVNIVTCFEDEELEPIQWIFYQEEGGGFRLEEVK